MAFLNSPDWMIFDMPNKNKHIEDYLDYYFQLPNDQGYAVLLRGAWGAGKTWFITKYIENKGNQSHHKFIYISLYGIRSISEIDDKLFQQIHPVLSSKKMRFAGALLKGILRTTIHFDFDSDGTNDGSISSQLPDIKIPDYLKDSDNYVLIFDDIERCCMSIAEVMGYVNIFVEHQGLKVVLVANEDELYSRDNSSDNAVLYRRIKEKLIGKTFEIEPDFDSAVKDIIDSLSGTNVKTIINSQLFRLRSIYNTSEYKNLRHMKQALADFDRLYNILPARALHKKDLISQLLSINVILSIEIRSGNIEPEDIGKIKEFKLGNPDSKEDKKSITEYKIGSVVAKYNLYDPSDLVISHQCWIKLFKHGYLDVDAINKSLFESKYFVKESGTDWRRLLYFTELDNDEFAAILKAVITDYNMHNYYDILTLCRITDILIYLASIKLCNGMTITDIYNMACKYVDNAIELNMYGIDRNYDLKIFHDDEFAELGYFGTGIKEYIQFKEYLINNIIMKQNKLLPKLANELLINIDKDIDKFCSLIVSYDIEGNFMEIPILSYMPITPFMDKIKQLHTSDRNKIFYAINKRYSNDNINIMLISERCFLEQLHLRLSDNSNLEVTELSAYVNNIVCNELIIPALERLKQIDAERKKVLS